MSQSILCGENIYKKYGVGEGAVVALDEIDIDLITGETLVLIGPSGSGKSTLLRCLNGLESVSSGQIWFDGKDVTAKKCSQRLGEVGMVFQHFNLFPHMSAINNVILAPCHVRRSSRRAARCRAEELLDRVGILERKDHYPGELSGGQQQRVAIARALAMDPKVLLFDEPTSALDPETIGEVLSVMKDLAAQGTTMAVATHEMEFAKECADKIYMLVDGRVIERSESPCDFFSRPSHKRTREFLRRYRTTDAASQLV